MDAYERLIGFASERIEGPEANRTLWELREKLEQEFPVVVCYEIVVDPATPWKAFRERMLARLAEHLKAKKQKLPGSRSVITPVWSGSEMYLFDSPALLHAIAQIDGVTVPELLAEINVWQADMLNPSEGKGEVRALPTPPVALPDSSKKGS